MKTHCTNQNTNEPLITKQEYDLIQTLRSYSVNGVVLLIESLEDNLEFGDDFTLEVTGNLKAIYWDSQERSMYR